MKNKIIALALLFIALVFISDALAEMPVWANGKIKAAGKATVDFKKFPEGRAKLMAQRSALFSAQSNLIEEILKLKVGTGKIVRDVIANKDDLDPLTSNLIRGYLMTSSDFNNNACKVTIEIEAGRVYAYLKEQKLVE